MAKNKILVETMNNISISGVETNSKALTVLNAARKIFLSHGFSASTTDMIQQEANVSKSTIYTYYKNKEALFTAVIEYECTAFTKSIRNVKFQRLQLREGLLTIANKYLDITLSRSGLALFRTVTAEAPRFPRLAESFYLAGPDAVSQIVSEKLEEAVKLGEITLSEITPQFAASLFMNIIRSEPHMYSLTHPRIVFSQNQREEWVYTIVDLFIKKFVRQQPATDVS